MKLILGNMTFGPQVDTRLGRSMVQRFFEAGYDELDSAYVYNEGAAEAMLGAILQDMPDSALRVATKVHPRITGRLDRDAVFTQLDESLRRLCRKSIDILYLHFPDPGTPVENALEAVAELHAQGKVLELGLSNYPAWLVVDIWHLCKEQGWPRPSVYQGRYNGLSRNVEKELLPALRKLGMRFYAYNPLAGGLLAGRYTSFEKPEPGRFTLRQSYKKRYWNQTFFNSVTALTNTCRELEIQPAEAAFRWLVHHSCLDVAQGDGIILGASKLPQLEQNLAAAQHGPLPDAIVVAFDAAWDEASACCPEYFQFFAGQTEQNSTNLIARK